MKLIELRGKYGSTIGNYAQVDDEDYEYLNQWKWFAIRPNIKKNTTLHYAVRAGERGLLYMHKILIESVKNIDHKDENGLNNQRNNLREATHGQNTSNRSSNKKYKGVYKYTWKNKNGEIGEYYIARSDKKLSDGKTEIIKKYCKTEAEAATEYNKIAIQLHGEYAKLNIINK